MQLLAAQARALVLGDDLVEERPGEVGLVVVGRAPGDVGAGVGHQVFDQLHRPGRGGDRGLGRAPEAQAVSKRLAREADTWPEPAERTAGLIAKLRVGAEAQEGMQAFLEKRAADTDALEAEYERRVKASKVAQAPVNDAAPPLPNDGAKRAKKPKQ